MREGGDKIRGGIGRNQGNWVRTKVRGEERRQGEMRRGNKEIKEMKREGRKQKERRKK